MSQGFYKCHTCNHSKLYDYGVWRCIYANCYEFKCPECYGEIETKRMNKIEDKKKNRRRRLFDAEEDTDKIRNRRKKKIELHKKI